jgi:hypothetical protein
MELCSTIRDELASYLGAGVKVSARKDRCVVTLPFTTLDKRRVTVVVEQHAPNTFIVHDGGKTSSELFCQGVSMTRKREEHQVAIAAKFGVHITGRLFKKYCKLGELQDGILAVAQCALMAMAELIEQKPVVEEETLGAKVSRVLQVWKPEYVRAIERNVTVDGVTAPHSFHFVSYPSQANYNTVAIKILNHDHPRWQAERFGFLGFDIQGAPLVSSWVRCAVVSRAEEWPEASIGLVKKFSHRTLEVYSEHEHDMLSMLPATMEELSSDRYRLRLS